MSFPTLASCDFREVTLEDRNVLDGLIRAAAYPLCEYSFTTLYCWRKFSETRWTVCDGWLFMRYVRDGLPAFLCPVGIGDPRPAIEACFDFLAKTGAPVEVTMVPEMVKDRLSGVGWQIQPDRANFDYIYRRDELANFPGRRFSRKRNQVAKFLHAHDWSMTPIGPADKRDCLSFLDLWVESNGDSGNRLLDFEVLAARTCIESLEALRVHARALRVGGRIVGLEIGEELLADVFVIHFEKADRDIVGAYPMLIREFARSVPERYVFINREQDLGVPGLRKAKEQLFPMGFSKAFSLFP